MRNDACAHFLRCLEAECGPSPPHFPHLFAYFSGTMVEKEGREGKKVSPFFLQTPKEPQKLFFLVRSFLSWFLAPDSILLVLLQGVVEKRVRKEGFLLLTKRIL